MQLELDNRVVVVTGGAKGIGAAIVRALVSEGARPAVIDRDPEAVASIQDELGSGIAMVADLRQTESCRHAIAETVRRLGAIDVLVNNAGVNDGVGLEHGDPDRYRESLRTNLHHYYDMAHFALPALKASRGCVLNIASKTALTGQGNTSGYASAKGAILALTREWAAELLSSGIRVNAIVPAEVMTPLYRDWLDTFPDPDAKRTAILSRIPFGQRMTLPEEIAAMACFLVSPRAGHVTGQHIHVDGGYVHLDRALT